MADFNFSGILDDESERPEESEFNFDGILAEENSAPGNE